MLRDPELAALLDQAEAETWRRSSCWLTRPWSLTSRLSISCATGWRR